jgi:transcriptional regulator with XRE-family HTH domain
MDPMRIGADVRLLRRQRGWTQARLGEAADVSRWVVSEIECGRSDRFATRVLVRVVRALGGYLSVRLLYHGEGLDRLRDRRHARLVELLVALLGGLGWMVETEVTFNEYGERGSIDILAFHVATGALLIVEIKTVVPDVGGMLATLDRKARLAATLARERGWAVGSVSRLLVLPEASTPRRRVHEHAATFRAAFPDRNEVVRRWLRRPSGTIRGMLFQSDAARVSSRASRGRSQARSKRDHARLRAATAPRADQSCK